MNKPYIRMILITGMLLFAHAVPAASPQISGDDNIQTVLTAHKGKQVTVKLAAGDELTGKVGEVTGKLVLLQSLSGKEYFDAVIATDDISAVIIRNQ